MKRSPMPRRKKPMRRVSTKRAKQLRTYSELRRAFLAKHPQCAVYSGLASVDVHHVAGRRGEMLNDESQWLAVSREAHEWIHENPNLARQKGWLA